MMKNFLHNTVVTLLFNNLSLPKFYRLFFALSIMISTLPVYGNTNADFQKNTVSLVKFWGLLKYYHPKASVKEVDWDAVFMKTFDKLKLADTNANFCDYLSQVLDELGPITELKRQNTNNNTDSSSKLILDLFELPDEIDQKLVQKLTFIIENRKPINNKYAYIKRTALLLKWNAPSYDKEKRYPGETFPEQSMRLLTLARYWNIIYYFYPFKNSLADDWKSTLSDLTKQFLNATTPLEYHLAILDMTKSIRDSHSGFTTQEIDKFLGTNQLPAIAEIINNKAVIIFPFPNSLNSKTSELLRGDVVTEINGIAIADVIERNRKYVQGSNEAAILRNIALQIFRTNADSITIKVVRNDTVLTKTFRTISRLGFAGRDVKSKSKSKLPARKSWRKTTDNIGYIYLGSLQPKQVKIAMNELFETKGLILDIRNYPPSVYPKLSKYLNEDRVAFAKFQVPDLSFPGSMKFFRKEHTGKHMPNKRYKGKVILLVNEKTQSMAEFTAMALQTGRDVTVIGSQTAGAVGDTRRIPLPGGFIVAITGVGIYYPDGKATQRIGIVPDLEVLPTIEGIRSNKDEVLEMAFSLLRQHNSKN